MIAVPETGAVVPMRGMPRGTGVAALAAMITGLAADVAVAEPAVFVHVTAAVYVPPKSPATEI